MCMIGGAIDRAWALGFGAVFPLVGSTFKRVFSVSSIIAAFAYATLIGVGFGPSGTQRLAARPDRGAGA